ncbi:hypothetical protein L9F63_026154, partial [Diploptera punctata]
GLQDLVVGQSWGLGVRPATYHFPATSSLQRIHCALLFTSGTDYSASAISAPS